MSDPPHPADEPTRVDLRSANIVEPRVRALADLFPEAVRDGRIDLEALAAQLGEAAETGPERFALSWPGKADAIRMAQRPAEGALVPMPDESLEWDTTENIIVEGENLEVLKLLQRSYHGRVKLIYIDPPYNTGKDFVYPDNFTDPIGEYLRYSGQADENGGRLRANAETSGRYHSAWLSMMWPRLHIARSLLSDDGLIAVSIDDAEMPRLRLLLDEVFGEENFVATVIWQKVFSPKNTARHLSVDHDYLLLYARTTEVWEPRALPRTAEMEARYRNPDDDPRGPWTSGDFAARNYYSQGTYPIATPSGRVLEGPPPGSYWRASVDRFRELDADGRIWWGADGTGVPRVKRFLSEVKDGRTPQTLWPYAEVGHTQEAKKQLLRLVEFSSSDSVFDTPKPVKLMRRLLDLATTPRGGDIVLDFFAGSGTMGEAVLRQNAEDGGDRRFILAQLPEALDDANHPTIAHVARARVTAAAQDIAQTLSTSAAPGFRSYRLSASAWSPLTPTVDEQLLMDHVQPAADRSDDALLAEVLLARGFDLVAPVEWIEINGARVASVADGALVVTFAPRVGLPLFEAMVDRLPGQIVVLEQAFADDEAKVNALQYLRAVNRRRDTDIELLLL